MAHPSFIDRSFAQIARTALARSSWGPGSPHAEALITRARLADARAHIGIHFDSSRAKDRRYAIHARSRAMDTITEREEAA
jgi:hypothetical protein